MHPPLHSCHPSFHSLIPTHIYQTILHAHESKAALELCGTYSTVTPELSQDPSSLQTLREQGIPVSQVLHLENHDLPRGDINARGLGEGEVSVAFPRTNHLQARPPGWKRDPVVIKNVFQ